MSRSDEAAIDHSHQSPHIISQSSVSHQSPPPPRGRGRTKHAGRGRDSHQSVISQSPVSHQSVTSQSSVGRQSITTPTSMSRLEGAARGAAAAAPITTRPPLSSSHRPSVSHQSVTSRASASHQSPSAPRGRGRTGQRGARPRRPGGPSRTRRTWGGELKINKLGGRGGGIDTRRRIRPTS